MTRLLATALSLVMTLALTACGGGNASPPAGANTGGSAGGNKQAPANTPGETPADDPNQYKKVKSSTPSGWHALKRAVRTELERHLKPIPADWKFVSGIVNSEAPGQTEGDEAWGEWEKQAAGAMLYFLTPDQHPARIAVEDQASVVAEGQPTVEGDDVFAWGEFQGGEVPVFAFTNKLGTYVVVGVVLTSETEAAKAAIRKWAESIQPE